MKINLLYAVLFVLGIQVSYSQTEIAVNNKVEKSTLINNSKIELEKLETLYQNLEAILMQKQEEIASSDLFFTEQDIQAYFNQFSEAEEQNGTVSKTVAIEKFRAMAASTKKSAQELIANNKTIQLVKTETFVEDSKKMEVVAFSIDIKEAKKTVATSNFIFVKINNQFKLLSIRF